MSTTATSRAAARTTPRATTTSSPTIAIAIAAAAGPAFARAFRTRSACLYRRYHSIHPVEVRLVVGVEISAAFDHCRGRALRSVVRHWRGRHVNSLVSFRRRRRTAHLGALLFQNCLARELDAVAFHGQNFHQDLVAFFQFIANIFDSVFGNFADVQQAIQAGQNLDERAEIGEAADLAKISLTHLGRSGQIADNL